MNPDQLRRTREELCANLERTGLAEAEVLSDLQWSRERLDAALHSNGSADPVDVWELRDYLETAVRDAGGTPVPFSTLNSANRIRARLWFRLRRAPRHDFTRR
ncbi:DUF2316 family protein [Brachybacterium subflavum]|uniref:DUF2316 family protein n=1 Tax=Brachybacterium subflavum TaxID=2585206 RepID=UPI001D0D6A87|nr:DUF2316 family protein [Brachybacterium subflavum]